ncbi:MAG: prepilin-type N-terminal cleavage/methylation domain-containing protein [Patescibacteria group bacterium]|nr:prepilin-type N-terminal cleavage/methylation domain-containing protein [Patescibacteria group bacterium]
MKVKKIRNTRYEIRDTNPGFTLLEVVVSLFIITMMITLFLANYNAGTRSSDLSLGGQKVASDIRAAQNKALGSTAYNGGFPAGGWGAHFDTANNNRYIIFADANAPANMKYDSSPDEANPAYGGQTISLPANIVISSISTNDPSNPSPSSLDITFLPPDPITRIYDGVGTSTVATITFKQTTTNKTVGVSVNALGLIQAK